MKCLLSSAKIMDEMERVAPECSFCAKYRSDEKDVLTAFTKFDSHNEAWLSAKEYTDFWMSFWKNLDQIYAGRTINIPLMGAGITRFRDGKPSKQELLEVMLWTMKISGFHNTYADKRINFVIYPSEAAEIDFYRIGSLG